jgi:mycothiol synthase
MVMQHEDLFLQEQLPSGYQIRPMALEYAQATTDLLNLVTHSFIGSPKFSLNGMLGEWKLPEVNLAKDIRIVFDDKNEVIAYGEMWDIFDPYVHKYGFIRVHPEHRGRGIGSCLLRWVEQRARAEVHRSPAGTKVTLAHSVFGNDTDAARVMAAHEYERKRIYYTMKIGLERQPEQPRIPEGIVIRAINRNTEEEAYFFAAREAFRDHYGFVEEPFERYYQRWQHMIASDADRYDPALWLAAFDGDEIAGICFNRLTVAGSKDEGWVSMVGVRRPWRRRGIAEALLLQSFNLFHAGGFQRVGLGVDSASLTGATRLYEKVGMHISSESHSYVKVLRDGVELGTEDLSE